MTDWKENRRAFEFRAGTCDSNVFQDVVVGNEYQLPEVMNPTHWVLDVGAHIGSFTQAALERGAQKIVAFEPDPENFCRARRHLAAAIAAGHVTLIPAAVVGGLRSGLASLSGYLVAEAEVNTGGAHLLADAAPNIAAVSITDLVQCFASHRWGWLKLDCEGGEWDILEGLATVVWKPWQVCGEYHPGTRSHPEADMEDLLRRLCYAHRRVVPHGDAGLGLFFADRNA